MTDADERLKVIVNSKKTLIEQRDEWMKLAKNVLQEEKTESNKKKLLEYTKNAKRCVDGLKTCDENINKLFDSVIYVKKEQVENWRQHVLHSYNKYAEISCLVDEMVSFADVMKLHNDRRPMNEVFKTVVARGVINTLLGVDIFYKENDKFNKDMVDYLAVMTPSEIENLQQLDKNGMLGEYIYKKAVEISNRILESKIEDELEDEEEKGGKR